MGDVIAGVDETPLMATTRALGCGTADDDAMMRAVPNITTNFLAGPWRSENGGPTAVRISTISPCFNWIYNSNSQLYTVIYTDKLILRARTHRNPLT